MCHCADDRDEEFKILLVDVAEHMKKGEAEKTGVPRVDEETGTSGQKGPEDEVERPRETEVTETEASNGVS